MRNDGGFQERGDSPADVSPIMGHFRLTEFESGAGAPRRGGRVRLTQIRCSLGEVTDLSVSGMRVRGKRLPCTEGAVLNVTIFGLMQPVEVSARIVWKRRTGWFSEEAGIAFEQLTPAAKSELAAIARSVPLNQQLKRAG